MLGDEGDGKEKIPVGGVVIVSGGKLKNRLKLWQKSQDELLTNHNDN